MNRTKKGGLGFALLGLLSLGCGTEREAVTPGKEIACPSGTLNAGNTILAMDCNTVVQYQGTEFQSSLSVKEWASAGLSSAPKVLREVDQSATDAQVQFTQTCRAYNSCQVSAEVFNKELARTQDQFRSLREKVALLQASNGNPAVLRSTLTEVYVDTVPEQKRAETALAINFTIQSKDSSGAVAVVADGATLKTGTELVFGVELSQTAHLYIFEKHQSGAIDVLFPNSGIQSVANPLAGKSLVRIPPNGQVFTLNNEDLGEERIYFAVSSEPLTDLEKVLRESGTSPPKSSVAPPMENLFEQAKPECAGKRGFDLKAEDPCSTLSRGLDLSPSKADPFFKSPGSMRAAATPGDSVILKTFTFRHVP